MCIQVGETDKEESSRRNLNKVAMICNYYVTKGINIRDRQRLMGEGTLGKMSNKPLPVGDAG